MTNRKAQILDSAERLVRRFGYDGFSYADLEKEIGIRKASIHHHYPSKADLAEALVKRYTDSILSKLSALDTDTKSAGQTLEEYVSMYQASLQGGQSLCLCVAISIGAPQLDNPVLAVLDEFHDACRAWLETLFRRGKTDGSIIGGLDPAQDAAACLALVEGAQLQSRIHGSTEPFVRATAQIRHRIRPISIN